MTYRKLIFLCLAMMPFFSAYGAQPRVIRLTTLDWPPYVGKKLPNYGFTAEIIRKAFLEAGIETQIIFNEWTQALETTRRGTYEGLFSAYYTDERIKDFYFSEPYAESILLFFRRKDTDISYTNFEDLKPYRIGVTTGFANTVEFDSATYLNKIPSNTEKESLKKLIEHKVDLVIMDKYIGLDLLANHFPDHKDDIVAMPPIEKKPLYLLFPRKLPDAKALTARFNTGLRSIRQRGLYDLILQRHTFVPEKTIFIATLEWPPYTGSEINNLGFVSEIVTQAYRKVNYKVHITFLPWARVLNDTEKGRFDCAFPAYYSDEREKKFILVKLNIQSKLGFMKKNGGVPINSYKTLRDLRPYRIGVVHGYVNQPEFDQAEYLRKKRAYQDIFNIHDLFEEHLDLVVIDENVATYLTRKYKPEFEWRFLQPYLDIKELYLAFSRHVPDAEVKRTAFEYGYEELRKDGGLDKIMSKFEAP